MEMKENETKTKLEAHLRVTHSDYVVGPDDHCGSLPVKLFYH